MKSITCLLLLAVFGTSSGSPPATSKPGFSLGLSNRESWFVAVVDTNPLPDGSKLVDVRLQLELRDKKSKVVGRPVYVEAEFEFPELPAGRVVALELPHDFPTATVVKGVLRASVLNADGSTEPVGVPARGRVYLEEHELVSIARKGDSAAEGDGDVLFVGIWNPRRDPFFLWTSKWPALQEKMDLLRGDGLMLSDVEQYEFRKGSNWVGVWLGKGEQAVWRGDHWTEFAPQAEGFARRSLRLADIETWVEGTPPVRRWIGILNTSLRATELRADLEWQEFHDVWVELLDRDMRLFDVETYVVDGRRLWAGLWHQGTDEPALEVDLDWNAFQVALERMAADQHLLVDVETYRVDGQRRWAAVWLGRGQSTFLTAPSWDAMLALWKQRNKGATRLVDIERLGE